MDEAQRTMVTPQEWLYVVADGFENILLTRDLGKAKSLAIQLLRENGWPADSRDRDVERVTEWDGSGGLGFWLGDDDHQLSLMLTEEPVD